MAGERTRERARGALAWAGALLLVALHLAPWRPPAVLWFGWLPAELAWRLAWTFLAWLWILWFCARIWRSESRA